MICFKLQAKNLPQASILFFRDFKGLYDKLEMFSRRLLDFSKYRTLKLWIQTNNLNKLKKTVLPYYAIRCL